MRFIQALKGTQVVQGVLLALQGLWRFYVCALRTPPTCAADAPGAGGGLLYQATCSSPALAP